MLFMSLGLRLAQDSSPYGERQGHATPTRSWKNAPTVRALITHLLNALPLLKEHGHHHPKGKCCPSLYLPSLKRMLPQGTLITPSNPYQRGLANLSPS